MADLIDFKKKSWRFQEEEDEKLKELKIGSLQKHFQCMRCAFRCARCGSQISDEEYSFGEPYSAPYPFCTICYKEYKEYQKISRGERSDKRYYWYNDEWADMWRSWLEYQNAMEVYRSSQEFIKLLDEIEKMLK